MTATTNLDLAGACSVFVVCTGGYYGGSYNSPFAWKQVAFYTVLGGATTGGIYRTVEIPYQKVPQDKPIITGIMRSSTAASDTVYTSGTAKRYFGVGSDNSASATIVGCDTSYSQFLKGHICEIFAFDNRISDSDFLGLLTWTHYKWGIF
jgi:hypothetical protein